MLDVKEDDDARIKTGWKHSRHYSISDNKDVSCFALEVFDDAIM